MNFLDIILIGIIALFVCRGLFRGLIQEVLSLVAIVLAVILAANFDELVAPHLQLYIDNMVTVSVLSYAIIFVATLVLFWVVIKLIRKMVDISLLGWLDRSAGGVFGFLEGTLICLVGLLFLQTFAPKSQVLAESYIAPRAHHLVKLLDDYVEMPTPEEAIKSAKSVLGIESTGTTKSTDK